MLRLLPFRGAINQSGLANDAMAILIDLATTILIQGATGREGSRIVQDSLDYGSRVLAGVTPGKGGDQVAGVPVYNSVKEAIEVNPISASVVAVPPLDVRAAAFEAIENRISVVVIVSERVPRWDVSEILSFAEKQGTRVIGPNSLGVICPGIAKLGGIGGSLENTTRSFTRGSVGIISRSGGMTCELASLLTASGIGQSACVSVGGDTMVGSNFTELYRLFVDDPDTRALAIFCEPGGTIEEEFAEFYALQHSRKPVVAFVAGKFVDQIPQRRFGHAAVIVDGDRGSFRQKVGTMRQAGIQVADRFSDIPNLLKEILGDGNVH